MSSKIIPIEQAVEMRNEYHTHVKSSIESARGSGYQATDFAWIDLETLKDYVALLEQVHKSNSGNVSGIRIYFSAYPNTSTFACDRSANVDVPGTETVFIVPTVKVTSTSLSNQYGNLEHLPFCIDPTDSTDPYKGDFVVINDLLCDNDNGSGTTDTNYQNKTSLVLNEMNLTPPPA